MKDYRTPLRILPDGVIYACDCRTKDSYGEEVAARCGLKKISFDDIGKTVRRRCSVCKKRWKIEVVQESITVPSYDHDLKAHLGPWKEVRYPATME